MPVLLPVYHGAQALVSLYTGYFSYVSIRKVQTYEEMSEKAAKYSNIAEHHLSKTRATMTTGALAFFSSLLTSTCLTFQSSSSTTATWKVPALASAVLAVGLMFSHTHISNYWRGKAKIPGVTDYNDAITTSASLRQLLGWLAVSWGIVTGWYVVVGGLMG